MRRKNVLILAIVWLLVMVSIVASTVTLLASGKPTDRLRWVSRKEYDMIQRYSRLEEVRTALSERYFQEISDEDLMTGALKGMMNMTGDPYTFYYTPDEMAKYNEQSGSEYQGIGILIQNNTDGYIEVIRVYTGGPADRAGILAGDRIVQVDGYRVNGENQQGLDEAVSRMKGEDGTSVSLTLLRDGKEVETSVIRGEVNVSNVTWEMLDNGIGYINIFQFTGDDVSGFETSLDALLSEDVQGLVIDLRNNPGGLLDDVVAIADQLLPEGIIVYTEDRDGRREDFYSDSNCIDLPLAVIINDMSASASEILAAAVQDYNRGIVIGEKSYGKGIVQTVVQFEEDGAGMQYTSSSYFTPSGASIHGLGVTPDITVDAKHGYVSYSGIADMENDVQLQKAVEQLKCQIDAGGQND